MLNRQALAARTATRRPPVAKVLCVLYDDPVDGYPKSYARDGIPQITSYPGGQTAPAPQALDFTPGQLLGSVSGELGLRRFLEGAGHSEAGMTVAEVTYSNSISVSEHVVMMILGLVRNYIPSYGWVVRGARAPRWPRPAAARRRPGPPARHPHHRRRRLAASIRRRLGRLRR
jgi:hypothetical protein